MKNEYYSIAINDLLYLEEDLHKSNYNPLVIQVEQVAEKALKSVLELVSVDIIELLHSHNLKKIYLEINAACPEFILNEKDLGYLKDFYYEAKSPGENFIIVSRKQCDDCLNIMYDVLEVVNEFRIKNNMNYYAIERKHTKEPNITKMVLFD